MDGKNKSNYRQTKEWKDFRKKLIEKAGYKCQICGIKKKKKLHIHHIDESKYGKEREEDVAVLCATCHKLIEWLLSRTRNPVDFDDFCIKLKDIYNRSSRRSD